MLRLLVRVEDFMKRVKEWVTCSVIGLFAAAAVMSAATAGCGSSTSGNASGSDTGTGTTEAGKMDHAPPSDAGKETGLPDVSNDVPMEAMPLECEEAGLGTQILSIDTAKLTDIQPIDITADNGYLIYYGGVAGADGGGTTTVYALPLTGTPTPVTILGGITTTADVEISGNTVFVWTGVDTTTNVGALVAIWSSSAPSTVHTVTGVTKSVAGVAAASPDSTQVVYNTDVNTAGGLGTLVGAAAATPTTTTTLLSNTAVGDTSTATFIPTLQFVSNTYLVAAHQESGSATITISSFAPAATWAKVDLLTGSLPYNTTLPLPAFQSDTAGDFIAAVSSAGQLEVIPLATGIAQNVGSATTTTFQIMKSGAGIVYGDSAKNLWTDTVTAGVAGVTPTTVANPFGGIYTPFGPLGLSPDGTQVLYYQNLDTTTDGVDLYLNANSTGSTTNAILTSKSGAVFGDVFTGDSHYVIYIVGLAAAGGMVQGSVGQLAVWDVATSTPTNITSMPNVWDSNALTGSVVLYNDNFFTSGAATEGIADLKTVDVSVSPLAPKLIQVGADMNYYLTSDKTKVVYTLTLACDTKAAGIYDYTF
jgi:hypothetical protein